MTHWFFKISAVLWTLYCIVYFVNEHLPSLLQRRKAGSALPADQVSDSLSSMLQGGKIDNPAVTDWLKENFSSFSPNSQIGNMLPTDWVLNVLVSFGSNYYKWLIPTLILMFLAKITKISSSKKYKAALSDMQYAKLLDMDPNAIPSRTLEKPFFVPQSIAEWAVVSTVAVVIMAMFAFKHFSR